MGVTYPTEESPLGELWLDTDSQWRKSPFNLFDFLLAGIPHQNHEVQMNAIHNLVTQGLGCSHDDTERDWCKDGEVT